VKTIWFVARLAQAGDPVTDILDVSDAVRNFDGTVLPTIPKSHSLPILRVVLPWGRVIAMLVLSGACLVALVGAGLWIWRGHAVGTALGRAALALAVGGLLAGGTVALGVKVLAINGAMYGYGVFLACELAALFLGMVSWRCRPGKVAAVVAPLLALASLLLLA